MADSTTNSVDQHAYTYLQLDLDWYKLTVSDLEKSADGALTLASALRVVTEPIAAAPALSVIPTAPSGIATTQDCACDLYISDPANNRLWYLNTCETEPTPLPCLQGSDELNAPRGLLFANGRLYVADSGHHRILVLDPHTQQTLSIWGQADPFSLTPMPGADPGLLNEPWALAADTAGNIYVVERGGKRVQKFRPDGQVIDAFWATLSAAVPPSFDPISIAIQEDRVYILCRDSVLLTNTDGVLQSSWTLEPSLTDPLAITISADALYVGSANGTLAKYTLDGQFVRLLPGTGQPITALATGCDGEILLTSGGLPVQRLTMVESYVQTGYFLAGPFEVSAPVLSWQQWRASVDPLDDGAHLQLFTYTAATPAQPPLGDPPFSGSGWITQPLDEVDVLILNDQVRQTLLEGAANTSDMESELVTSYFWLGGVLHGSGTVSPVLRQMRIDYAPPGYIRYLPATYQEGAQRRLFLELVLALFQSELERSEDALAAMAAMFDPAAAPAEWLPWLASWLDFDLLEDWPVEQTRQYLAEAMSLYQQRGTREGLRRYLKLYAGVDARIEEPGATSTALFALNDYVALGFNTVLVPAHEQGAVLSTTAVLAESNLLDVADIGVPLFEDVANRFTVEVYAAQLADAQTLDVIRQVLEREKPAHTDYALCVIEPTMRVGFQARIGIDSIVAGPMPDLRLGDATQLGTDTVLTDQPRGSDRRLGHGGLRVGETLKS